ncbi:uncharacterized protein isoform X2 [Choristoneura fumiferana]|uniref:uncharacterized protein isoform X2 n=1 Tax=Choristoneura fumiferana TaxID=7141 RepID=UPI003D15A425
MGKCCVEGCTVASDDVEYFKFPASKALRSSWLAACGAAGDVCSAHFAEEDYQHTRTGRRLRSGAVPCARQSAPNIQAEKNADTNKTDVHEKDEQEGKSNETTDKTTTDKEGTIEKDSEKTKGTEDITDPKLVETQAGVCVKENGINVEISQTEEKDIEDMITNYQIKQTKTLADRLNPEPLEDLISTIMSDPKKLDELSNKLANNLTPKDGANWDSQVASKLANRLASKLDSQLDGMLEAAPVYIEVPAKEGAGAASRAAAGSPLGAGADCVMVLESVQCDVDPSSVMLMLRDQDHDQDHDHAPDTDSDMEITCVDRKEDPISLLTSSDEDEVIIEEPHIDTVEVSDETDEDDKPLTTLIKKKETKTEKCVWGMYEFYCVQCDYRTLVESEFKKHMLEVEHSNTLQICPICSYTTASKAQYSRHKRKHKDERNFKCHLCNYKARHNMSLIYHLKSHNVPAERSPKFSCDKCGFSSHLKSEGLKHIKVCVEGMLYCDSCSYSTKRKGDMRRHKMRKHLIDDDDEDFRV